MRSGRAALLVGYIEILHSAKTLGAVFHIMRTVFYSGSGGVLQAWLVFGCGRRDVHSHGYRHDVTVAFQIGR